MTPFCQPVVEILGLVEGRDSFSKDGEDNLGRGNRRTIAGLKPRKDKVQGKVFLGFPL